MLATKAARTIRDRIRNRHVETTETLRCEFATRRSKVEVFWKGQILPLCNVNATKDDKTSARFRMVISSELAVTDT